MDIPEINQEFTITKENRVFYCKVVGRITDFEEETYRVQILGQVENTRIIMEEEPRFVDVNPSWFD